MVHFCLKLLLTVAYLFSLFVSKLTKLIWFKVAAQKVMSFFILRFVSFIETLVMWWFGLKFGILGRNSDNFDLTVVVLHSILSPFKRTHGESTSKIFKHTFERLIHIAHLFSERSLKYSMFLWNNDAFFSDFYTFVKFEKEIMWH